MCVAGLILTMAQFTSKTAVAMRAGFAGKFLERSMKQQIRDSGGRQEQEGSLKGAKDTNWQIQTLKENKEPLPKEPSWVRETKVM